MLTKFSVENYRGFKDKIELDLSKHKDYEFNTFAIKNDTIKSAMLYGANGTGKTNFGLALFDIVDLLTQKVKKEDYYNNFVYAGNEEKRVSFEYIFCFSGVTIKYQYAKDKKGNLKSESFFVDNKTVFERDDTVFSIDKEFPMEETVKNTFLKSANSISVINYICTTYPLEKNHYFMQLQNFVNTMLWFRSLDIREFIGLEIIPSTNIAEYVIKNGLIDDFQNFLKDVSDQNFKFDKEKSVDNLLFCIIDGNTIEFSLIASTGTRSLLLLYFWLKHMEKTSFVFIDEFDAFYHYALAFKICKKLFNLDTQVLASSHNTHLMTNDLLRPDCNFIIGNNEIKALCDCTDKELRFGHNMEKLYKGNTFAI